MRENGGGVRSMDMVYRPFKMVKLTKVNFVRIGGAIMVCIITVMEICMTVNGEIITDKEWAIT